MKPKDELFVLIKSMDRNEKGYFRKFSKLHGSKRQGNYLKLFDCIATMDSYDEGKIHEVFKGEKFLTQLGVTKLYLRNLIIKSLRNYVSDSDPDIELMNGVTEVSLLTKRKMYDSAMKLVNKLKKTAHQREAFLESLTLVRIEFQLKMNKSAHLEVIKTAQSRLDKENEYLRLYQNVCEYKNLQAIIACSLQIEGMAPGGSTQKIKEYINHPLLINDKLALSFRAKTLRLEILSKCYLKAGDRKKSLQTAEEFVSLFVNNPARIKIFPLTYTAALDRMVTRCTINHKYDDALRYVSMSEELLADRSVQLSESERQHIKVNNAMERIVIYAKTGLYEKSLTEQQVLDELTVNDVSRGDDLTMRHYFYAWCKLATGQPEEALKRINGLLNDKHPWGRKDVILSAHGMNIIIHYELGNYLLIKRLLKMLHNYIIAHDFNATGWPGFSKKINEITAAKTSGNAKELKKAFHELQSVVANHDFVEVALIKWWIGTKLKQ